MLVLTLHHAGPTSIKICCLKSNRYDTDWTQRITNTRRPFVTEVHLWDNTLIQVTRDRERSPPLRLTSSGKRAASQAANHIEFGSRVNNRQHSLHKSHTVLIYFKFSVRKWHCTGTLASRVQYSPVIGTSIFRLSGKKCIGNEAARKWRSKGIHLNVRYGTTWTSTYFIEWRCCANYQMRKIA